MLCYYGSDLEPVASVNAGIDIGSFLNSDFALRFPTFNDITAKLKLVLYSLKWMLVRHSPMLG